MRRVERWEQPFLRNLWSHAIQRIAASLARFYAIGRGYSLQQEIVDRANSDFWNELCGSSLARNLGIKDHSRESIVKFDSAYLSYYPYLLDYIGINRLKGLAVLEIGLGYGTVSRVLARSSGSYVGLDISAGPVNMVNESLKIYDLPGRAVTGSALRIPAEANTFDVVVSIGCLHHTGSLKNALAEVHRVLKPGGRAILMVYNGYSYRQWIQWPIATFKRFISDHFLSLDMLSRNSYSADERMAYDSDSAGRAAPATEYSSKTFLQKYLKFLGFDDISVTRMNSENAYFWRFKLLSRETTLKYFAPLVGLDLYFTAVKADREFPPQ